MINIQNVSFKYSGASLRNLINFSLKVEKGECVVLTGESGCGKTCVTRLINALIPHFYEGELTGKINIEGMDTTTIQPHDLSSKIGSVFQNPRSQFFSLDTDSEIVFGLENKGVCYEQMKERYKKTIEELHIEELKGKNLFALSGGQKQTIALASVYALEPDIFVLDEPSSNLDLEAIEELRRLLLLMKEQGKTIIISEHRLYFLNGIADRIVRIEKGELRNIWTAEEFEKISKEDYKKLGLRSYTKIPLLLSEKEPVREEIPVLQVKNLFMGYKKGSPVASNICFSIYEGEIVGVVGKNGCGKTTLARTICGLQNELSGEILYYGEKISRKKRRNIAYLVMQDPEYQLFTDSVYQELNLALFSSKKIDKSMVSYVMDELNLTNYAKYHPMSLSGGQKQRVTIATAMLRESDVFLFDEPTSGLDYKNMESVASILQMLARKGKAILVISHDNEFLMKICTRVIYMDK